MNFSLWLESDWNSFLSGHFQHPYDETRLLIFADWLDEQGENFFANAIRHVLTGHEEKDELKWNQRANELLIPIYDSIKTEVEFPSNMDDFKIGKNVYRVALGTEMNPPGEKAIMKVMSGKLRVLEPKKWTLPIVKAAVFIILRDLTSKRVKLGRDERLNHARSSSLRERNLQSRLNHLTHRMNNWLMNWHAQLRMTTTLRKEKFDIGQEAQYLSWMIVSSRIPAIKFVQEIQTIRELFRSMREAGVRIPVNLTNFMGDINWWLTHPQWNESTDPTDPAKVFIQQVVAMGQRNPLEPRFIMIGDIDIEISRINQNTIHFKSINNLDKKNPFAVFVLLRQLANLADKLGVRIDGEIQPYGKGGLKKNRLKKFYTLFGAKFDKTGLGVREPREMVMYHGTNPESAENIRKSGFDIGKHGIRQKSLRGQDYHPLEVKGIYLTTDINKARDFYAGNDYAKPGTGEGDVVEVEVDETKIMNKDDWNKLKYQTLKSLGVDNPWNNLEYHKGIQEAAKRAKEMGFIGIQEFTDEFVIFDPKDVKIL